MTPVAQEHARWRRQERLLWDMRDWYLWARFKGIDERLGTGLAASMQAAINMTDKRRGLDVTRFPALRDYKVVDDYESQISLEQSIIVLESGRIVDLGIRFEDESHAVCVFDSPAAGQYCFEDGCYSFAPEDIGKTVFISYAVKKSPA
jgi:hypothetical protein